jgi:hypothetical protein
MDLITVQAQLISFLSVALIIVPVAMGTLYYWINR